MRCFLPFVRFESRSGPRVDWRCHVDVKPTLRRVSSKSRAMAVEAYIKRSPASQAGRAADSSVQDIDHRGHRIGHSLGPGRS